MYDGIKIEASLHDRSKWNNSLHLIGRHSEQTGEILPLPSECDQFGLTFSRTSGKFKTHHTIQGSLHRFFRKGLENDNDYTLEQVIETVERLQNVYGVDPVKSKIINFEFGVNITLPEGMDAQGYQKYLVSAYTKAFEKLNPKRPMVGYIAEFNEYNIKVYDKGFQARNGTSNQLRVEIKVNRTRWLDQFGFKKGADLHLSDLLNQDNIKILGDILLNKVSSLIVTPRDLDIKKLSPKQKLTFYECRDARSWEEWNSKQRERKRQQLDRIFKTVGQPNPIDVLAKLVEEKWQELTTTSREMKIQNHRQKVRISTLIVEGICVILALVKMRKFKIAEGICIILALAKMRGFGIQTEYSYLVYQPRGIPLPNAPPQPDQSGFRRWIDLNCNSPPSHITVTFIQN